MADRLAAQLMLTPAGVVHLLASREVGGEWEPERQRRAAKRLRWTANRVIDELRARDAANQSVNHAAVQRECSRLVAAAREFFGSWDAALAAAGVEAGPPHGVPELRGLRRVRLARGYSQGALAARSGVSAGQISTLEAGKNRPRSATATALARALAVAVEDLVRG